MVTSTSSVSKSSASSRTTNKVMGQISDSLWEIIRSKGSTRTEITETVVSHRNNNKSKLASCFPQPS
ncbi:hypothetical protein ES332_D06G122800v1 [Gossypium tomentosum]|uniref:Uncharacterized protein n=1 Tax=Gossypium tomentosum TaxID=34277 RepID=A0A5D2KI46_GOSTO|nr:hypothetical protein ES332_D06G122800v1 [Gossypium tomentosum]